MESAKVVAVNSRHAGFDEHARVPSNASRKAGHMGSMKENEAYQGHASLVELPFTELYVRVNDPSVRSRYKPDIRRSQYGGKSITPNLAVEPKYDATIDAVRMLLEDKLQMESENDLGVIMHDDMRLRYTISYAADHEIWAALRPIPLMVPTPEELNLNAQFIEKMTELGRKKGLILIGGKTGQGKTTTAVSLLKSYCVLNGGTLFTIEDPVEYILAGAISERSWCIQHDITKESEWKSMADKAKRFNPDYLLFGEIRTQESAEQLISAANRGHLVVATIHSASAADTVSSLLQLVSPEVRNSAQQIVGTRLLSATFQTMTAKGPYVEALFPEFSVNDNSRKAIIEGDMNKLANAEIAKMKATEYAI